MGVFISDHAVLPGNRHVRNAIPCQDYAMSGGNWAIASDGCSGGEETDLGSRIWTLALAGLLKSSGPLMLRRREALQHRLMFLTAPWLAQVGPNDGIATLVALGVHGQQLIGSIAGDGGFLVRLRGGDFFVLEVNISDGTKSKPLYIDYFRSEASRNHYMQDAGDQVVTTTVERYNASGILQTSEKSEAPVSVAHAFTVFNLPDVLNVPFGEIEVAVACTDGIFSRPTPRGESFADLVGFKNFTGQFARRRLGALGARWASSDSMPIDDLAIAAIHLD